MTLRVAILATKTLDVQPMNYPNVIQEKSDAFAIRIVNANRYLRDVKHEYCMSNQICKSGTSIQANVAEAQYAESRKDFVHKMSIALKEANETRNWINVLHHTGYIDRRTFDSILKDINEIIVILVSIIKTAKRNEKMK